MDGDRRDDVDAELQRAQTRMHVLGRATTALYSTLSIKEGARRLARILASQVADWCAVDLLDDAGRPHRRAVAHRDTAKLAGGGFEGPLPPITDATPGPLARVFRGAGPLLLTSVPAEAWEAELFGRLGADTAIIAPLQARREILGALTVARSDPGQPFTEEDRDFIAEIARRASLALDNARLHREVRHIAERMQRALLPELPQVGHLRLAARYSPAHEAAEVGGDWYDAFLLPKGDLALVIGDVAGHDLPAAVVMSQLRNMMRALAYDRQEPPGEILSRLDILNDALSGARTATCLYGLIRGPIGGPWSFQHASAGHMPPLLVTREGEARYLEDGSGLLLGVDVAAPRPDADVALPPCATLLLFTDGLVERPGEDLGHSMNRLRRQAAALAEAPLESFCDEVLAARGAPTDDIALLAVRVPEAGTGRPAPPDEGCGPVDA